MPPKNLHLQWCIQLLQYLSVGSFSPHLEKPVLNKFRTTAHITSWTIMATSLGAGILNSADLKEKAQNLIALGYMLIYIVVYMAYVIYGNIVHNLIKAIEIEARAYSDSLEHVSKAMKEAKRFRISYLIISVYSGISCSYAKKYHGTEYWELRHFSVPFELVIWGKFETIRIIISLILIYHGYCFVFYDIISAALFTHVGRQFDAVSDKFSKMHFSGRQFKANETAASLDEIQNDAEAVDIEFRKAFQYHQMILKCAADLQTMFSAVFMIRMILSTVLLCFCMFLVVQDVNGNIADILGHISSFSVLIYQLYIMSRSAEITSERASRVADAIYQSNWDQASPAMRRQVAWVIQRAQHPPKYSALGFFPVTSNTFVSIIKGSYSLLTLLLTTD